ncbi:prenyltransferase/squalene oxidase repeat-containing protein [Lentzea sp. NPDC051838]|uniref:prenyltransferase/squalene oxidase repeat-containing protein n=1 Tax=Lentzea sp. NPDC051838 TaxID=3154849 RepID=UPI00344A9A81
MAGVQWTMHDDRAVADLLDQVSADPLGHVSSSLYETARLLVLAPWLTGHAARLRFLLSTQNADGSWGAPDGYGLVPTLSATDALLTLLRRAEPVDRQAVAASAQRGLARLTDWLATGTRVSIPDTIAAELIVPWLVDELNAHRDQPPTGVPRWPALGLPSNIDDRTRTKLHRMVRSGQTIPEKAWHSLEAFGADARRAALVRPSHGVVCGSAAATAAWLGDRSAHEAAGFLDHLQSLDNGPVRGITRIAVFETAWVVSMLADAGVPLPRGFASRLRDACADTGAPAGAGLPADGDDTAAVLYALSRLGEPGPVEILWSYEGAEHFHCFPQEQTPSISANAHILDALGEYARPGEPRFAAAIGKITGYLLAEQRADGSWQDKWHASPYYATTCCAQALHRTGGPGAERAVARALDWVLDTQRDDGSWGRWQGTAEETAYAVQLLLLCGGDEDAATRAADFLRAADDHHPPLWHDKDLYTPITVVRAARLAALRLIATRTRSTTMALGVIP